MEARTKTAPARRRRAMSTSAEPKAIAPPDARRKDTPLWYQLVSEWNTDDSEPGRKSFAAYMADDVRREVERQYALAEVQSYKLPPSQRAELAGHQLAHALVEPHRDAVTHMIEAPAASEQTLALEAVPSDPDTFA